MAAIARPAVLGQWDSMETSFEVPTPREYSPKNRDVRVTE